MSMTDECSAACGRSLQLNLWRKMKAPHQRGIASPLTKSSGSSLAIKLGRELLGEKRQVCAANKVCYWWKWWTRTGGDIAASCGSTDVWEEAKPGKNR